MQSKLERRVVGAAQSLLDHQHAVAPLDVLGAIGWLPAPMLERWHAAKPAAWPDVMQVNPGRVTELLTILHRWATARGLEPTEIVYVPSTRDRSTLRFTADGDPAAERAFATHWMEPKLSAAARQRLVERRAKQPDLVVLSAPITTCC